MRYLLNIQLGELLAIGQVVSRHRELDKALHFCALLPKHG